jgi:hypothetical protein
MSKGGSLLRGDYSTKLQLCPRDCGGASLELWIVVDLPRLLACFDAKMLVASLPSASPGGWLQVSAGLDPAYASKLSYPLM